MKFVVYSNAELNQKLTAQQKGRKWKNFWHGWWNNSCCNMKT